MTFPDGMRLTAYRPRTVTKRSPRYIASAAGDSAAVCQAGLVEGFDGLGISSKRIGDLAQMLEIFSGLVLPGG